MRKYVLVILLITALHVCLAVLAEPVKPREYAVAAELRTRVKTAISEAAEHGLFFRDVEDTFMKGEKYYTRALKELNAGKHHLAALDFKNAANWYSTALLMLERSSKGAIIAALALFLIITFFSFIVAKLLVETGVLKQLALSLTITIVSVAVLYVLHPGFSTFLTLTDPLFMRKLVFYGELYLALFYLIFVEIPKNIAPLPNPEGTHFWGAAAAAFHISVNNLKRRRIRTTLTAITVILSVTAFIAFMSVTPSPITTKTLMPMRSSVLRPAIAVTVSSFKDDEAIIKEFFGDPEVSVLLMTQPYIVPGADLSEGYAYWYLIKSGQESAKVFGVVGMDPRVENRIMGLDRIVRSGRLPERDGEVLISSLYAKEMNISLGGSVLLVNPGNGATVKTLRVVGFFDAGSLSGFYDVSGKPYRPRNYKRGETGWVPTVCRSEGVIITVVSTAYELGARPVRIAIPMNSVAKAEDDAVKLADYFSRGVMVGYNGMSYVVFRTSGLKISGEHVIIPVLICYFIAINAMLASVYERRREFVVYSAIGLNPSHIKYLFMTEALLLGVIGGAAGYLLGLMLSNTVTQVAMFTGLTTNISPAWALISILLSMLLMMLATLYPASRASVEVVPSFERRWRLRKNIKKEFEETLPARVEPHLIKDFVEFIRHRVSSAFPPLSTHLRSQVSVEKIAADPYDRYEINILAELASEGQSTALFKLVCEYYNGFYRLKLRVKPLTALGGRYKWLVYTVIDEIRRDVLAWQAIYKSKRL